MIHIPPLALAFLLFFAGILQAPFPALAAGVARPASKVATRAAEPDRAMAQSFFGLAALPALLRQDGPVPGWPVAGPNGTVGYIASTWEIARSVGYSERPMDMLVAVDTAGHIAGAQLMRHAEPILTSGLSDADIEHFVGGFAGLDLTAAVRNVAANADCAKPNARSARSTRSAASTQTNVFFACAVRW